MSDQKVAGLFDRAAAAYGKTGPPFFDLTGRRLTDFSGVSLGETILDVATGRGAVLLPAADRVGEKGLAVGIDLSAGMLGEIAAESYHSRGVQANLCQMNAGVLAFETNTFDIVLCGHAIFFFPQAAREFWRVLKPGGRVGLTIIAQGCFDWLAEIFQAYTAPEKESFPSEEGERLVAAIDTVGGLGDLLRQSGFEQVRIDEDRMDLIYPSEKTFWEMLWTLGFRSRLEGMDADHQRRFKAHLFDKLQDFLQADGFHILFRVYYALAVKP